jgi:hypothetical protein
MKGSVPVGVGGNDVLDDSGIPLGTLEVETTFKRRIFVEGLPY